MANKDTTRSSAESYREDRKARLAQSAKKRQKNSEKKKAASKIIKQVIAIVLVAAIAVGLVWKIVDDSAVIKKNTTVFSMGSAVKVSEVEFVYYYGQYLNNIYSYAQQYAYYGYDFGIDPTESPDEQTFDPTGEGDEMLLSDYIAEETISSLCTYKLLYNEALKAGYKLTDDETKDINEQIEELRNTAAENNYSLNAYLSASYGKGVNEKFLRNQIEMQQIVTRYQNDLSASLTDSYTDDEIKAAYDADKSAYNAIDARTLSFAVETLTKKDGESDDEYKGRQEAAVAKVKAEAEKALKACTSEKAFLEQAKKANSSTEDYDADTATALTESSKSTITSYVSEDAAKWAFDSARKSGDVKLFEVSSSGTVTSYVILFINKGTYAPLASDVRHILVSFTDDASSTTEATDEQKAAAKKSAEEIYKQWKDGEKTEDSFAALAKEKSADEGSAVDGGLISGITSNSSYVTNFLNWSIDSKRKAGDTEIIESEYGYHIMYFCGTDYAWKSTIRAEKASSDFENQLTKLQESDEYKLDRNEKKIEKALKSYNKSFKKKLAMSNSAS